MNRSSSWAPWALLACLVLAACGEQAGPPVPAPAASQTPAAPVAHATAPASPPLVRIVPEAGGPIAEWILFAGSGNAPFFVETMSALIAATRPGSRVRIAYSATPIRHAIEAGLRRRGFGDWERLRWLAQADEITWWARDQFVLAEDARRQPVFLLHHPQHYRHIQAHPGDPALPTLQAVRQIAGPRTLSTEARLEGGAVVADTERAFLTPLYLDVMVREGGFRSRAAAVAYLQSVYGIPLVPLAVEGRRPTLHADMFLTLVGRRRALLGDPVLGRKILAATTAEAREAFDERVQAIARATPEDPSLKGLITRSTSQALLDAAEDPKLLAAFASLAEQLTSLGYEVRRVPWLGFDGEASSEPVLLSWTNVVQEVSNGRRTVYLPVYGLAALDDGAEAAWAALGYRAIRIPALGLGLRGGGLRCLTQTIRRRPRA